ncbi:MAG: hypothetical protein Q9212_001171 [Teloschistes hypoglaucus]
MMNGATGTESNAPNAPTSMPTKQHQKINLTPKAPDSRKMTAAPNDGSQRKTAPPTAWQTGTNPITQRSTTRASQNGNLVQAKAATQKPAPSMEVGNADKHAHDRLVFLHTHFLGLPASITVKDGDVFSGIFYGSSFEGPDPAYLLKMVQKTKSSDKREPNGGQDALGDYIGHGEDHAMSFEMKDVAGLAVDGVTFDVREKAPNGVGAGFRTDTDISGNLIARERNLQRWEPSADAGVEMSLEGSGGAWDQFQANEQQFGLKSDYNENIYTTSIDKSHPDYRRREAEAIRLAQEIEGGQAENAHVREERGINHPEDNTDEEEKYSGVRRQAAEHPLHSNHANRYMPPARRPPTGKPTVPGAPVDPAIISMQMAGNGTDASEKQAATKGAQPEAEIPPTKPEDGPAEAKKEASEATASAKVSTSNAAKQLPPIKTSKLGESATANVENEVLDSFRQFASNEKLRISNHHRQRATQDKAIKLNDLMKFSQNFKLLTPVPKDLVPILAKDKSKQEAIIEKAQRNAESGTTSAQAAGSTSTDRKAPKLATEVKPEASHSNQDVNKTRHMVPPQGPQATQQARDRTQQSNAKAGPSLLSHRLADSHRQHKAGLQNMPIPQPIPIQGVSKARTLANNNSQVPSGPQPNAVRTPTSATSTSARFNVRAMEFRPNPTASSFRPPGEPSATSSPRSSSHVHAVSRPTSPSAFFGSKKPLAAAERESISDHFNPLKRLREIAKQEGKEYLENGGIRRAFATPPTWFAVDDGEDYKSYKQMFDNVAPVEARASPQHGSSGHLSLAHQHQLPVHLQQPGPHVMSHVSASQHAPFHAQPQPPHFPTASHHYDEHRMHLSTSSSSVYPSPRMQNATMAYPSPMTQQTQLAYGQPMTHYFVPNGPQPAHFGRHFPGAPPMMSAQGAPLTAPMMVQQSSQGGYMGPPHGMALPFNPQMPMYPPGQPSGYNGPSQPPNNFPSPSRGAPMMMHSGSHQGQQPPMFMGPGQQFGQPVYAQQQPTHVMPMRGYGSPQPHFSQSPQPQYHYPHQPSRAPSGSYGVQPSQGPHQHMPAQQPPPTGPMEGGDDMK